MSRMIRFALFALFALFPATAIAGGIGQGGIVVVDELKVYKKSAGQEEAYTLRRGEAVAGFMMSGADLMLTGKVVYQFDEKDGRVHIVYFEEGKKLSRSGWTDPAGLSRFVYDGSCGAMATPLVGVGTRQHWNACFQEARDAKLAELKAPPMDEKEKGR